MVVRGIVLAVGLPILFIAYLTKEMPVGYTESDATFRAIPAHFEDGGRILGGPRLRVLRTSRPPGAKPLIDAWCFIFIGVIRELSASIILFTPSTKVMSVVIFRSGRRQFGAIAVLGVGMFVMTFATVARVERVLGRDFLGARE